MRNKWLQNTESNRNVKRMRLASYHLLHSAEIPPEAAGVERLDGMNKK